MTRWIALSAFVALFTGCATVRYDGDVYPPVEDALVVQSRDELSGEYVPIGRAVASVPAGSSGVDLREALEEKAEEVGAHAVVLGNYRYRQSGKHLHWHYERYRGPYDTWWDIGIDGPWGGQPFTRRWYHPEVHYQFDLQLKALFLRRAGSADDPAADVAG